MLGIRSLKSKVQIVIVATFGMLLGGILLLFNHVVMPDFRALEENAARDHVHRIEEAIQNDIESFQKRGEDQAYWDDAYEFVRKPNPEFISSNLSFEALSVLDFRTVAYYSLDKKLRFGAETIGDTQQTVSLSEEVESLTRAIAQLVFDSPESTPRAGLVRREGGVNIAVALPILDSNMAQKPAGVLVILRDYDQADQLAISQRTRLNLKLEPVAAASSSVGENPVQIQTPNTKTLMASGSFNDIYGTSIYRIDVALPRDIFQRAVSSRSFLMTTLALFLFLTCGGALVIIERWVTGRVVGLARQLEQISVDQNFSGRVSFTGKDEIHILGLNINKTLSSLSDAQNRVAAALNIAERANDAKKFFFSTFSHDLRNKILSLDHYLGEAVKQPVAPEVQAALEDSAVIVNDLQESLTNLLDWHKLDSGTESFEDRAFNLRKMVGDKRLYVGGLSLHPGVEFVVEIDPDLPAAVRGDPVKLGRVVENLLSNAVKFTESGQVGISVRVDGEIGDLVPVVIEVWDTGMGIPAEKLPTVFGAFEQAHSAAERKGAGYGLGLFNVKRMIEGMGGAVSVSSVVGQGTRFQIRLGFKVAEEENAGPPKLSRPVRAIVADDSRTGRTPPKMALESIGCIVDEAADGEESLAIVRRIFVENSGEMELGIILTDVEMPNMSGRESMREIRELERVHHAARRIPIIAVTSHFEPEYKRELIAEGFDAVVEKPLHPDELFRIVREFVK